MKRVCLTLLLLALGLLTWAQRISVKDFYFAENDLTARTHGTSVEDQNGNLCALIKVETTEKGLWTFDVGMLGVRNTEMQNVAHSAEIWVYVPYGVTWIKIQHEHLGKLSRYTFPCSIEKGCTYVMQLTTGEVTTIAEESVIQQYLAFQITPADAVLEVDGKIWEVDVDGSAQEYVVFGTYEYRVQAPNYHPVVGKVTVNDPENTAFQSVTLSPNFGWIEVGGTGDLKGASVYIDNALIGQAPCKSDTLKSGKHMVRIAKKMYDTYIVTVMVYDNQTTPVNPVLVAEETFTVNGVSFTMKFVEGGSFWMGATSEPSSVAESDEQPAHDVTLNSFYIGETEVTQALWKAVMGTTISQQRDKADKSLPLRGEGDNYPMYYVSWDECLRFIKKLNQLTGKNFRLPTEAEWEYAARGGKKSNGYQYSGSNSISSVAWYSDNSNQTNHAVKGKLPNELGLYDMSGNVWERCSDLYGSNYYEKSPSTNPQGPSSGSRNVLRGGSWNYYARDCRVSNRYNYDPAVRSNCYGFRLCLST